MGWAQNLDAEVDHWRWWFTDPRWEKEREQRRRVVALPQGFGSCVGVEPGQLIRVLDVGSGPISTAPAVSPEHPVELTLTDPLAAAYSVLLDEYGYDDVPRPLNIKGEDLTKAFEPESFHHVVTYNALDHCEDPAEVFEQMWTVLKPRGLLTVVSFPNEGERDDYRFHEWNLEADDEHLWLWNRTTRVDLLTAIGLHQYSWSDLGHQFAVYLRKLQTSTESDGLRRQEAESPATAELS